MATLHLRNTPNSYCSNNKSSITSKTFFLATIVWFCIASMQATNYYSIASGNWSATSTWSLTSGGSAATSIPGASDAVYIQSNKTVTLNANTPSLAALTISLGSTLSTTSANTLSATTITINGTYINGSSGTVTGTMTVGATGTYQHNQDGGIVPTATWNATSTCIITGYVSQAGGSNGDLTPFQSSMIQNFGHFTWNCSGQTAAFSLGGTVSNVAGNFSMINTGSGSLAAGGVVEGDLIIAGNFIQSGGTFQISSSAARSMTVNGNFTKSGGVFDLTSTTIEGNAAILFIKGNYSFTGGTITETGATLASEINFSGTGIQTFTSTGTYSNKFNIAILAGATVDFGTSILSSGVNGSFTLNAGATLITANTNGTGALTTSKANGTIQVGGARTYSAAANYTFNGAANQTIGNGLPTNLTGKLTINNIGTSGNNTVTLNNNISIANGGSIYLTSGIFGAGTKLTLNAASSTIYRSNGSMTGTIQGAGAGTYNVEYSGNSKTTGTELSGGGLNNITVSLTSGQILTLDQNRTPDGNISVSAGSTLNLSTFTINRSTAGGSLTLDAGSILRIGGVNTLPTNYNTHSIHCTSTIDYNGTTQTVALLNSAQTYGKLILSGSGAKTLQTGITNICSDFTLSGTANTTAVVGLTIGGNVLIDVNTAFTAGAFTHNVAGNWTKNGTFTATGSTINFNSSSASQSIGASNFNNISFAGAGLKTATGALTIAGDLTIGSNLTAGSFNHTVAGNWTNNGTFTAGQSTITMTATTAKTIGGSASTTFNNLSINSSGGVILGVSASVSGILTLTSGKIDIGNYNITVASTGSVSGGSATSYVKTSGTGRLKQQIASVTFKTYPIGNSAYNPITVTNIDINSTDNFSLRVADATITNANNSKTVNRQWYILKDMPGSANLTVAATYNAGEEGSGFNKIVSPRIGYFSGSNWAAGTAIVVGTTFTAMGTTPGMDNAAGFLAIGSDNAFNASKFVITNIFPSAPVVGTALTNVTIQSQNSNSIPTYLATSTAFDLSATNTTFVGTNPTGTIAANTYQTLLSALELTTSTLDINSGTYLTNASLTATRTSGEALTAATSSTFAVINGNIYEPKASGNWSNNSNWRYTVNGGSTYRDTTALSTFGVTDLIRVPVGITLTADVSASFYSLLLYGTLDIDTSGNLTVNHNVGSSVDLDHNLHVHGILKNSGGTLTNSDTAYPFAIHGGIYIHNRNGGSIPIANWTTLNGTKSTCQITGITTTPLTGLNQAFENFTWNNAGQGSTVQELDGNLTTSGVLTLTNGVIKTNADHFIEAATGSITRTNGYINGNFRLYVPNGSAPTVTFPIGDANTYAPISISFVGTVSGSGYLDAITTAVQPPLASGISQTNYINRKWTIENNGVTGFTSFNTTFTFADADKVGSPNTSTFVIRKLYNNIWSATAVGTRTANSTQCAGMTTFSDFVIGEDDCTATNYVWLGGTSTDWNTASNWCYNQVPTSTVDVTIPSGPINQPNITASATCKNITITNGASLIISGANALSVKGNFTNSGTFTPNASTVTFSGTSAQTITGVTTFNNLTVNNAAGVVAANDLTVYGTLNLQSANSSATTGAIHMGSYTLNMGTDALTTGTGDITGIVKRQQTFVGNTSYTFGNANTTISFTNIPGATKPTWISCKLTLGTAPDWRSQAIKRVYSFAQDGTGNDRTVVHLHYLNSELHDSETDETKLVFWDAYTGPEFSNTFPRSKSNFDATNNWIGLAGMAINFFAPSSTLDYKQWGLAYTNVTKIIWTGNGSPTYSGDWSLPGNWNGGVPTANDDVLIPATLPGDTNGYPTQNLNSETTPAVANSIEIENGATLTVNNYPITIYGSTGAWINNGTFVPGTGTVTFNHNNSSEIVTIGGTTNFYNLNFAANTVMRPNTGSYLGIGGNLTADGSSILEFSSSTNTVEFKGENQIVPNPIGLGELRGYNNLIFSNTGTSLLPSQLNVDGNLTTNGSINTSTNSTTLILDGTSAQTISGSVTSAYHNITINNAAGVIGSTDITVNGTLTFLSDNPTSNDKGALAMATDKILDMGANSSTIGAGEVSGIVRRTHTFNTGNFYSFGNENNGVIFAEVSGYPGQTLPSSVSLKTSIGTTSNWSGYLGPNLPTSINRNWELIQTGGTGTRALMRVHYLDNEIPNGISESDLTIWTSSWIGAYSNFYNKESGRSNYNSELNYVAIQDVNFAIIPSTWGNFKSTLAPTTTSNYTWIGTVSTDWNNTSNWTPNSVPDATHGAIIPNTYTTPFAPTLPTSAICKTVQLAAGAVLNAAESGGTLTLTGANAVWNAETGAVFNANTSEVIFNANSTTVGNASINGTTNFYNLTIANGALLQPAAGSHIGIAGSLTNNGTLATATNENTFEFNGSETQNIPNANGGAPGYHNLIFSGSGTKNLPETLNIVDEFINYTSNSSVVSAGSGKVIFNGNAVYGQAIAGNTSTVFNDITFDNTTYSIGVEKDITVNGTLEITTGSVVDLQSNVLSGTLSTINNNGVIKTQNNSATSIPSGKSWSGTIVYNGTDAQTIPAGTYANLTVENAAGVIAGGDITVNSILNLAVNNPSATQGVLDTDVYTLNMGAINTLASITTGPGDVTGVVKRAHAFEGNTIYSFGHQSTSVTFMNFPNTTKPTWLSCKIALGTVPTWRGVALRRYYSFSKSDITGASDRTSLRLHYLDSELNTETTEPYEPNESKLEIWDAHNGPTWSPGEVHGKSNNDAADNWIGLAGMSIGYIAPSVNHDFKQWGLSYSDVSKRIWTGIGTDGNDWSLTDNWNGGVPTAVDRVVIPAGVSNYPTKNLHPETYPVTMRTLEIEQGASMGVDTCTVTIKGSIGAWLNNGTFIPGTAKVVFANDTITKIATIAGSTNFYNLQVKGSTYIMPGSNSYMGILGTITSDAGCILDFTANKNTVEFKGGDQTIDNLVGPSTDRGYHDLILSGTGTKTLPETLNIAGDFINNGTVNCGTGTVIMKDQGHVQNIGGTSTTSFYNLIIDNTDQIVNATADFNVNNTLTINFGTELEMNNFNLGGNFSSTEGTGVLKTRNEKANPIPDNETWAFGVEYNNANLPQTVPSGTFPTLRIKNNAKVKATGNLNCASIKVEKGSELDMGNHVLNGGSEVIVEGIIKTQNSSSEPLPKGKRWTGAVIYNGTDAQTVVDGNYDNLEIDNASGVTLSDSIITRGTLLINSNKKITINEGAKINSQLITNNAGMEGMVIKSNSTQPNATLIFNNPSHTPVSAKVEMYSKAGWTETNGVRSNYRWQFIGIPVQSLPILPTFYGAFVRKYNESGKGAGYLTTNRWMQLQNGDTMEAVNGYEIVQAEAKTYEFDGTLFNQDINLTLNYTSGADNPGQHLIGNPYTAAIAISQIHLSSTMDSTIYIYNTGTIANWSAFLGNQSSIAASYNAGQYTTVPLGIAGRAGIPGQIPSMQAFMVKTKGTAPGTIFVDYDAVKQDNKTMQRAKKTPLAWMRLNLIGATADQDVMWVFSKEGSTRDYDNGWDGRKLAGDAGTARIQAVEGASTYQIDVVPDINETVISARAGRNDTEYKLKIENENMLSDYNSIYLLDLKTNDIVDISQSGSEYRFTMTNTSSEPRFKILTSAGLTTGIKNQNSDFYVTKNEEEILIHNLSGQSGMLTVFDFKGMVLANYKYSNEKSSTFKLKVPIEVLIFKALDESGKITTGKICPLD